MSVRTPDPAEIRPLLTGLIGRRCSPVRKMTFAKAESIADYLAVFVGDDGAPLMLAGGDIAFAHLSGAALALVPLEQAQFAIDSKTNNDDLLENYREILNVVTRAINDQGGDHVRMIPGDAPLPDPLPATSGGHEYTVTIDGYGDGKLFFWTV